jgi:hypothetical protein
MFRERSIPRTIKDFQMASDIKGPEIEGDEECAEELWSQELGGEG